MPVSSGAIKNVSPLKVVTEENGGIVILLETIDRRLKISTEDSKAIVMSRHALLETFDGWRLPTQEEALLICSYRNEINELLEKLYIEQEESKYYDGDLFQKSNWCHQKIDKIEGRYWTSTVVAEQMDNVVLFTVSKCGLVEFGHCNGFMSQNKVRLVKPI